MVDGANLFQVPFQVLFWVIFPMLKPVTATVIILAGVAIWKDFALSVVFLQRYFIRGMVAGAEK